MASILSALYLPRRDRHSLEVGRMSGSRYLSDAFGKIVGRRRMLIEMSSGTTAIIHCPRPGFCAGSSGRAASGCGWPEILVGGALSPSEDLKYITDEPAPLRHKLLVPTRHRWFTSLDRNGRRREYITLQVMVRHPGSRLHTPCSTALRRRRRSSRRIASRPRLARDRGLHALPIVRIKLFPSLLACRHSFCHNSV